MVPMSIKKNRLNETPLFKTCKKGNENIVKYLVELGVDINKQDKSFSFGKTLLHKARESRNENFVKFNRTWSRINNGNKFEETSLSETRVNRNESRRKSFVENKVDINKEIDSDENDSIEIYFDEFDFDVDESIFDEYIF